MGKTFIRRPGNKTNHLKHIIPLVPKFTGTYYEPFVGTGAVFLALNPKKWVINDLNKYIYGIWKTTRDNHEGMLKRIKSFGKEFMKIDNTCKLVHLKETKILDPVDYLIASYCSFDGAIEVKGKFRISGLYFSIFMNNTCHIFSDSYTRKIQEVATTLKCGKIYNRDYSQVLKQCREGDFVFLDPPYIETKSYNFEYTKGDFDINRLLSELKVLDSKKVKWMMTQIYTPQVKKLFCKYNMVKYVNDNCFAGSSTKHEVIVMNY